jgi:hypothetical protein
MEEITLRVEFLVRKVSLECLISAQVRAGTYPCVENISGFILEKAPALVANVFQSSSELSHIF